MHPSKSGEPSEITVGRDELASGLDRECRQPRIGDQIPAGATIATEPLKDFPMTRAWRYGQSVWLAAEGVREGKC